MKAFSAKQPGESYELRFGFAKKLGTGNTIASISSVAAVDYDAGTDASGTLLDAAKNFASGQNAYIWVQAGEDGKRYLITVTIASSYNGEIYELEGLLPVRETE